MTSSNSSFCGGTVVRLLTFVAIAAVCWHFNTDKTNIWIVIVSGHAHFLATYVYKAQRGQITPRGLLLFFLAIVTFVLVFPLPRPYRPFVDDVSLRALNFNYLVLHIMVDEQYLAGLQPGWIHGLEIAVVVLSCASVGLRQLYGYTFAPYGIVIASACVLAYLILTHRNPQVARWKIFIFWTLWAAGGYKFLQTMILYHFAHWYIHMYERFRPIKVRLDSYLKTMLAVNLIVFLLFAPFLKTQIMNPHHSFNLDTFDPLLYVFLPHYFWIWSTLHLIFTSRSADLAYFRRLA